MYLPTEPFKSVRLDPVESLDILFTVSLLYIVFSWKFLSSEDW